MSKTCIVNLPIGLSHVSKVKDGYLIQPSIIDFVSRTSNYDCFLTVSSLDSYVISTQSVDVQTYETELDKLDIKVPVIDLSKYIEESISLIDKLIYLGKICAKETENYVCSCKRVDIDKHIIDDVHSSTQLFYKDDSGKYRCKVCNQELQLITQIALMLKFPNKEELNIQSFPLNHKKQITDLINKFENKFFQISKKRETGIKYTFEGIEYNLDVEFINLCLLAMLNYNTKIVLSSHHVVVQQIIAMVIDYYINQTKKYIMLLSTYIVNEDNTQDRVFKGTKESLFERSIKLKLLILNTVGWKKESINGKKHIMINCLSIVIKS